MLYIGHVHTGALCGLGGSIGSTGGALVPVRSGVTFDIGRETF